MRQLVDFAHTLAQMTTTLSVRIDAQTKKRLEALAGRARRSKSFLAAEAITASVEAESWALDEIEAGVPDESPGRPSWWFRAHPT
jgi:predicted transcriptional regulator